MTIKHVIHFSGGAGSWQAGKRVVAKYGKQGVVLLAADTGSEADDWHEFVRQAAEDVGAKLVLLPPVEPGGIFDLADKHGMLPANRIAFCSKYLKHQPLNKWISENCGKDITRYFGFDIYEIARLDRLRQRFPDWQIEAPLCWRPYLDKAEVLDLLKASGLPMPAAYGLGMQHNNCLATGCVKGGFAYWQRYLELWPERYAESERREQAIRNRTGKPSATILKIRRQGVRSPLTLREFRQKIQAQQTLDLDMKDHGSCGCFLEEG